MRLKISVLSVVIALSILGSVSRAAPVGSAFTYQGQLKLEGKPVTDTVDVRFTLYDAEVAGNVIGSALVFDGQTGDPAPIDVVNGLFSASLDFGVGSFDDQARWLQVEVRSPHDPTNTEPFIVLNPRQNITPTPFALETRGINVDADGNVGIGTASPTRQLHVFDTTGSDMRIENNGTGNAVLELQTHQDSTSANSLGQTAINFLDDSGGARGQISYFPNESSGNEYMSFRTEGTERMRLSANGNVGIGTTHPGRALDVVGDVQASGDVRAGAKLIAGIGGGVNGTVYVLDDAPSTNARVKLEVEGLEGRVRVVDGNNHEIQMIGRGTLSFINSTNIGTGDISMQLSGQGRAIRLFNTNGEETVTLAGSSGHIRGKVIEITGADVAERFPVKEDIKPGMVVAIDPENPGHLRLSRTAYSHLVAGVASGANGLSAGAVLGNLPGAEHAPPIALTGRVWCACDASLGAIEPGDLLTTSNAPGRAMKATKHAKSQGAILGKAMTSLKSGHGLVLVLVSLQ